MISKWFYEYASFLYEERAYNRLKSLYNEFGNEWSEKYKELILQASDYWEKGKGNIIELRNRCKNEFKSQIVTHVEKDKYFAVTLAAYEVRESKDKEWDAWVGLIKLPTRRCKQRVLFNNGSG